MKINQIGGEFELIQRLANHIHHDNHGVIQGIGDDSAVLETAPAPAPYLLVTSDTMVENHHFNCHWASPKEIGFKAGESNVSDIAAMGGTPDWMVVSLSLPRDIAVEWVEDFYRGLDVCCRAHRISIVGGDTTQGEHIVIGITLFGHVKRDTVCLRSHARVDDIIMVTGFLGASGAAQALLEHGLPLTPYLREKHVTPKSRYDISSQIAPLANAMIDISDGLAPETSHICKQSIMGAELFAAKIPIHPDVVSAGKQLNIDPLQWALSGGEDYELLFTIKPENAAKLKHTGIVCHDIGKITSADRGTSIILSNGERRPLPRGYNHFYAND